MKGVFTTRINPAYDDQPETRYQFPATYLRQAEKTVGDFVVYYEPGRTGGQSNRRDGSQSYFAVAKVAAVIPDAAQRDHYYALIDASTYLDFDQSVPFRASDGTFERGLLKGDGTINRGAFGRSVRNLANDEFDAILAAGFSRGALDFIPDQPIPAGTPGFHEEETPFERPQIELTISRPFRDRAFSRQVRQAYDRTCAFTGLKIVNGFGRPEVQAAHIQPVADLGPDTVRNGLALSSTVHWLFDRGLVSVDNDFRILTAASALPEGLAGLLNRDGRIRLPDDERAYPNARYLRYHRENIFKG